MTPVSRRMLSLAGLHGRGIRDDVSRQLASVATIEWHERAADLVARANSGGLDAVITELDDEFGHSIAQTIVTLAAACPTLPILIYDRVSRVTLWKLLAAFVPGLRMEFAVRPYEPLEPVLRRSLQPTFRPSATPVLLQRFVPSAPQQLRSFVALAVLTAPTRREVGELAAWTSVSARTIDRWLVRAHWPSAHIVLWSFIALDAVWLMSEYGWSAQLVHTVRGFSQPSSVTHLLQRYCGLRPATLHEDGGFAAALEHVTRVLTRRGT